MMESSLLIISLDFGIEKVPCDIDIQRKGLLFISSRLIMCKYNVEPLNNLFLSCWGWVLASCNMSFMLFRFS